MSKKKIVNLGDSPFLEDDFREVGNKLRAIKGGGFQSFRLKLAIFAAASMTAEELSATFLKYRAREMAHERQLLRDGLESGLSA